MATLHVLGSGSRGNCCAIASEGAVLLVDAGFSAREIERRAGEVGVELRQAVGIVLTHEHGDHAQGAVRLADRLKIPIVASAGTLAALKRSGTTPRTPLSGSAPRELGPFLVEGASTSHDAAEPMAVAVSTGAGIRIGYATDLGRPNTAVRWLFRSLSAVVLEANYDEVLLRTSQYPVAVQQRIAGFGGHLSNGDAAELLRELFHPGLQVVVLAHLSQQCNSPQHARDRVGAVLQEIGYRGRLEVAAQSIPLEPIALALDWEDISVNTGALADHPSG